MLESFVLSITREALVWVMLLSGPPLLAAMIVGVGLSILQATTQIQDQTMTLVPKIFSVFAVIAIMGPWAMSQIIQFATQLFERFPQLVQ